MANIDLNELSVDELQTLKGSIDSFIVTRRQSELLQLREKFEGMAAAAGFTLEEVMEVKTTKKRVVLPKYCNPDNPQQTWSGRGRKPAWVANHDLNNCLI